MSEKRTLTINSVSKERFERFETLVQVLVTAGFSFYLPEDRGSITVYPPGDDMGYAVVFNINGTWSLE